MRIALILCLFICSNIALAELERTSEEMTENDTTVAADHRIVVSRKQARSEARKAHERINVEEINAEVLSSLENGYTLDSARLMDRAIANLLTQADTVLRSHGAHRTADEIKSEHLAKFADYYAKGVISGLEIGDHDPMSAWLVVVHQKIENALGEFLCSFFHFHDLFVLNYGLPVVFHPASYNFKEYNDSFSGHKTMGFFWIHHGVAGVVTYWISNFVCGGVTAGMGMITFVCGAICGFIESSMDTYLAPPMAQKIWDRANN